MDVLTKATNPEVRAALIMDMVLGFWIIVSPFVLLPVSAHNALMWSNIASGAAVIVLALLGGFKQEMVLAIIVPLAGWIFASGFVLNSGLGFAWNNVLSAFAVIADSAISDGLRAPVP
jgi:SPW repeat